jgi:4-amino-4-deoxy-L-arabinose transferase-like glycosyltransferase
MTLEQQPAVAQKRSASWPLAPAETLLLGGLLFRCLVAALLPSGFDESYYFFYGLNPSLSYYDHPMGVGVWSWLGQRLGTVPLALRTPSILSYTLALWLLQKATERWFNPRAALWAVVVGTFCPLLFLCGGVFLLPDSPLVLALAFLLWWLSRHPRIMPGSAGDAVGLGIILGAITISKYHALLILPALLAASLRRQENRQALGRPWPWLTVLVWMMAASPLWIWNVQNGWVSFQFQYGRTGSGIQFDPLGSLLFILTQVGVLFPTFFLLLVRMLWPERGRGAMEPDVATTLRWIVWPQVVVFVLLAGRMQVMTSWLVPAWWMLLPLAGDWLARREWKRWPLRFSRWISLGLLPPILLFAAAHIRFGLLEPLVQTQNDPSSQLMTPEDLRAALKNDPKLWKALCKADVIASYRWEMPGYLAGALNGCTDARFTVFGGNALGFAFWDPPGGFKGKQGVIFAPVDPNQPLHTRAFDPVIGRVTPLGLVQVQRSGRPSVMLEFAEFGPMREAYPRDGKPQP